MKKLIVANWKMHPKSSLPARSFVASLALSASKYKNAEIVIAPPYPFFALFPKKSSWALAAQDVFWEPEGAYTGEISGPMLKNFGVKYVIIGHSERRIFQGETDEHVNKKVRHALASHLAPIICIGEAKRDSDGAFFEVLQEQLTKALLSVARRHLSEVVIAYEPVWAISGGGKLKAAKPEDANEAVLYIRKVIAKLYGVSYARRVRVIYGGSVDGKVAPSFLEQREVEGFLVGRESNTFKSFEAILACTN